MNNPQPLRKFGEFTLIKELSSSGNSQVYLATEAGREETFSLQIFSDFEGTTEEDEKYFLQQGRQTQHMAHKYLAKILDVQDGPIQSYMVMEHIEARTFRDLINANELDIKSACRIIGKVASAVSALHAAGISHLNIHPGNILIDSKGVPCLVGIGSAPINSKIKKETVKGTITYSSSVYQPIEFVGSPAEFMKQDKDPFKCDLYSLGIVLYEAVTGIVPFPLESSGEIMLAVIAGKAPLPSRIKSEIDAPLDAICMQAIQRLPENRYASMRAFSKDLKAYLKDQPVSASNIRQKIQLALLKRAIAAFVGLAALVLIVVIFFRNDQTQETDQAATPPNITNELPKVESPAAEDHAAIAVESFTSEEILSWSEKEIQAALNSKESGEIDWQDKLTALPDSEESVKTLVRFLNVLTANSNVANQAMQGGAGEEFNAGFGSPGSAFSDYRPGEFENSSTNRPLHSVHIIDCLNAQSTSLASTVLQEIALSESVDSIQVSKDLPPYLRKFAATLLVDESKNLSAEKVCQIAIRHRLEKPLKYLTAIPVNKEPATEVATMEVLMQELISSSQKNANPGEDQQAFGMGSSRPLGSQNFHNEIKEMQLAIVSRLGQLNQDVANDYLLGLLEDHAKSNSEKTISKPIPFVVIKQLISHDDQPRVVDRLTGLIADPNIVSFDSPASPYQKPKKLTSIPLALLASELGPMLRKECIEEHWNQNRIPNEKLLSLIPFQEVESLPALKSLYSKNGVSKELRNSIEIAIADIAAKSSGIALGWIAPDVIETAKAKPEEASRYLQAAEYGLPYEEMPSEYETKRPNSLTITLSQQPIVQKWLNDEKFIQLISQRLKVDEDSRSIVLEILASSLHPVARTTIEREIQRFAEIGPRKFAGQSIAFSSDFAQQNATPYEQYGMQDLGILSYGDELYENGISLEGGEYQPVSNLLWGDPWMIVALKSPKRIRAKRPKPVPRQDAVNADLYGEEMLAPISRRGRGRSGRSTPVSNKAEQKELTPREIQQAWFLAVRDCVEVWHTRCESAISRMPPGTFQDAEIIKLFSLKLPKDTTVLRKAVWNSEVDKRGIQPLPAGHRIGFIEFETKIHPKRFKEMFEEIIPNELGHGDDEWTDSSVITDGIERNIDILYSTKDGQTKGSILILERPADGDL